VWFCWPCDLNSLYPHPQTSETQRNAVSRGTNKRVLPPCLRDLFVLAGAPGLTLFADSFVLLFQFVQLFVRELFHVDQIIAGGIVGAYEFIQLQVDGFSIAVLGVLDEKHHQEGNQAGCCIDYQLPCIRVMKIAARQPPEDQDGNRGEKHRRMADELRGSGGESAEPEPYAAGPGDLLSSFDIGFAGHKGGVKLLLAP